MAEPFLGEVRLMSFPFAPKGWAQCNGQILAIAQNQALFSLLGTSFGGNGQTTFGLPDFRGRVAMHSGTGTVGQRAGEENHTLITTEIPSHTHTASGSTTAANSPVPTASALAGATNLYGTAANLVALRDGTLLNTGGSQPHSNMQPYQVVNFCIALVGIYPSRN